ncbi:MAG TPA: SH3 domain-containing protein [Chloroflexi bacterium]|nr:SH3 domain-containing protein [Chloroflexota bacterium]
MMPARLKALLFAGLVIAIAFGTGNGVAAAQARTPTLTVRTIFDVNIRALPGINSAVVGVLPAGETATAIGRTEANNWIQIQYQETTGWVASWVVTFSGDTSILPITTPVQPPPASQGGPFELIAPYNVNLRAAPDVNAGVLMVLRYNTAAEATGRNAASSWLRVRYQGQEGWVAAWPVIVRGDITALPIAGGAGSPPPVATPQPSTTAPSTSLPEGAFTVIAPFRVNIRSAPSLSGTILDVLPFSTPALAVGRNEGNNWIQVEYGETRGWVAAWVVVASADTRLLPVTSPATEITPSAGPLNGRSIYEVAIRTGPGLNFGEQGRLPPATDVTLLARTEDNGWVQINYQGVNGWVAAWLLVASADISNLPVQSLSAAP